MCDIFSTHGFFLFLFYFSNGRHDKRSKTNADSVDPGQPVQIILASLTQIKVRFDIA